MSEYKCSVEYVKQLPIKKFTEHILICMTKNKINMKQMEVFAGAGMIRSMV